MKKKVMSLLFAFVLMLSSINVNCVYAAGDDGDVTVLKNSYYQQTLQSGKYKITDNVTFDKGLRIPSGAVVEIDIPEGLTLTCNGQNAGYSYFFAGMEGGIVAKPFAFYDESSAGITVEEGATLILSGDGNLVAKGGDGLAAEDGLKGYSYGYVVLYEDKSTGRSSPVFDYGEGGAGGAGGYAPSPAIGGDGGKGGSRTEFCKAPADKINYTETRVVETANNGYKGNDGEDGGNMGTVYILDSLHVTATAGTNYPDAGKTVAFSRYVDYGTRGSKKSLWHLYTTIGAPGGGGGGSNESAIIGGGGAGGGGGGSGASGSISASTTNNRDIIDNMHKNASAGNGNDGGYGGIPDAASMNRAPITLLRGEGGQGGENGSGGTLYISSTASVNDKTGANLTQSDLGEMTNENAGQAANVKKLTRVTVNVKTDGASDGAHSISVRGSVGEYELSRTDNEGEFYGYVPTHESDFIIFADGVDSGYPVNTEVDSTSLTINYYSCNIHVKRDGSLEAGHNVTLTRNNSLIGTLSETAQGIFSGVFLERYDNSLNQYNVYVDGNDSECILYSNKTNPSQRTVVCNFYTAKVTVKLDGGTWKNTGTDLNVSLRGNGKTINMSPTSNAGEFSTVLSQADSVIYSVYVNNVPSKQTISVSSLNTEVNYFTGTLKLSLDGSPFENASVIFTNGNYSYTAGNGVNNGTYRDYKLALPENIKDADSQTYAIQIAGVVDSGTHSISASQKTATADFVSVEYYTSSIDSDSGKIIENNTLYQEYAVLSGLTINPAVAPYLKGMTFSCWNENLYDEFEVEADETSFDFTAPITESTKLYAHFNKPNVQLNGVVRCDENRTIDSDGAYYYLPNLYISGYAQTDAIKYIKAEFTNIDSIAFPTDDPNGDSVGFSSLSNTIPQTAGVYLAEDTITIEFTESISVQKAQEYLRRVLVKPTLNQEHTLSFTVSDAVLSLYNREDYAYTTEESDAYTKITSSTAAGTVLESGYYYVSENVTLDGSAGGIKDAGNGGTNGLVIAENANVLVYIPKDVTLTVIGANGNGQVGGKAGILLPETSTLTVIGKGTLIASGGNGGNAGNGSYAPVKLDYCVHSRWQNGGQNFQSAGGNGGTGGYGGGGGGAGIGTDGGQGGAAVGGGGAVEVKPTLSDSKKGTYYGGAGANGNAGSKANDCGDFLSYGITVQADGGNAGNAGTAATSYLSYQIVGDSPLSSSGYWTWGQMYSAYAKYATIYDYGVYTNGVLGASGGGGGAGYSGRDIGNGGSGGGSGGGGAGGGIIISPYSGQYIKASGGKGGQGSTNGADAITNIASGTATNPNAAGIGGTSDNTGKEITSSDYTLAAAPQYTITFDATDFNGEKTIHKYDYFTGTQISLPEAVSVKGLAFLGWSVTTYGSNLNGDVTDCTLNDTKLYSTSAINLSENTSGDIILKPMFEEIAAKYASGSLKTTFTSGLSPVIYDTYKIYTKMNGSACDVESLVLKDGTSEYNLSSDGNGEYSLIAETGKEFAIWCNGADTGKKIVTCTNSQTVEFITIDIDVRLNDISTESLGVVKLVGSGDDYIELSPVYKEDETINGYHAIRLVSQATSYDIYLDGKDTGKDLELSSSAQSLTLNYYTIAIETRVDGVLSDLGTVTLRNSSIIESVSSSATPGAYSITKASDATAYTIYVGDENTAKTASFSQSGYKPSTGYAYQINYRTVVVNTQNNGVSENLGTVELKQIGSSSANIISVPNTAKGVYEVVLLEDTDTQYQVYIGGIMTDEIVNFTENERICTLSSITLSLKTALNGTPSEIGTVVLKAPNKPDILMDYQSGLYKATTLLTAVYDIYVDEKDTGVDFDAVNTSTMTMEYFTLHYDTAGGSGNVPGDIIYLDGSTATLASVIPSKENFQFIGWNDNAGDLIAAETEEITVSENRHTLTAAYNPISDYNARYREYGGEWTYTELKDALTITGNDSTKNYEIEMLKDVSLDSDGTVCEKVSLMIPSGLTLSGNLTNNGTIKLNGEINGTVNNFKTIEGCGEADENYEIISPAIIATLNNQSTGSISGCKINLVENNLGSLTDCHIVSGTAVEGFLRGTIYAQEGVTFGDCVAPQSANGQKANINLEGGGTLNSFEDVNNADLFAGLMAKYNDRYHLLANIHLRNKITVSNTKLYSKFFSFTAPENLAFNGEEKIPTFTSNYMEGVGKISKIYYRYVKTDGGTSDWTSDAPKEAGTYQVKIDVKDGRYFLGSNNIKDDSAWSYTIEPHVHTYATAWSHDGDGHWHAPTCGHNIGTINKETHTFGAWFYNNDATDTSNGTKSRVCSVCGYKQTIEDDEIHEKTEIDKKDPTPSNDDNKKQEEKTEKKDPVIKEEVVEKACYCHYIILTLAILTVAGICLLRHKDLKIRAAVLVVDVIASIGLALMGSCSNDMKMLIGNLVVCVGCFVLQLRRK